MKRLKDLITLVSIALGIAAVSREMKRPRPERSWQGSVMGVPYDLRFPPTLSRIRERWWNRDDPRLFTPHVFGVGWSVNLYQLSQHLHCASEDEEQRAA